MKNAAKLGGLVVALDYNHDYNSWDPDPPAAFRRFYQALLDWRSANQWDNRMAEHLPELFRAAGIVEVEVHVEDETAHRGDPDFFDAAGIWTHVIVWQQIAAAGFLEESDRGEAEEVSRNWVHDTLRRQTLSLSAIEGRTANTG
jgi:hypothetical protein